ncbi:hypothetical protein HC358_03040 [Wolbachia pipientis]|uniref:Uncharacterized protein n=1 Tax=Wolbachia pipientis TaxID=955 RepID=A0A7G5C8M2_WOLPI|nr:hypothetical protein [Wolbachia pipientis]QMV45556.1 hypothetical protein HC358_03040 [Wolbachia pipientis]
MTLVHPVTVSFQRPYDVIPVSFFCHPSAQTLVHSIFQCPYDVIPVLLSRHPSSLLFLSSQCSDTGIQVAHKQTSIESGYNVFDEIIWKTGSQCRSTGMAPY